MIKKKNSRDGWHSDVSMPVTIDQSSSLLIITPIATNQKFRTH
jgi:hypothetical protein